MSEVKNLMIAGVGGQGNVVAARILGEAALRCGFDVKMTETHGMAQRGGAVISMIRIGKKVYSPMIPKGSLDLLISLEILEGLRWVHYLKKDALILVSTEKRPPYLVSIGKQSYPENIEGIYEMYGQTIFIPARELAEEAGSARSANVVMLGAYSYLEDLIDKDVLLEEVSRRFSRKEKLVDVNVKAFELGYNFLKEKLKLEKGALR
jgi:indolepyruvate ferredoxin oxidoreductase beta subunit